MDGKAWWVVVSVAALWGCGPVQSPAPPPPSGCHSNVCSRSGACGTMLDGCGGAASCGACPPGQICGGGGAVNTCGVGTCAPVSCVQQGKNCGLVSDGCSEVLDCGQCPPGYHCGGDSQPNVCVPNPAPPSPR